MNYKDDENLYSDVIDILKQLPKVNTPSYFEADLMRKINSDVYEKEVHESFWSRFLSPARLLPSAAVAIAAVIMLFVVDTTSVEQDDPLSAAPRLREDMIQSSTSISLDDEMERIADENDRLLKRKPNQSPPSNQQSAAAFASTSYINKSGLNFRQRHLTDEQKQR